MQHRLIEKYTARPLRWLLQHNVIYWHEGAHRFSFHNGCYKLSAQCIDVAGTATDSSAEAADSAAVVPDLEAVIAKSAAKGSRIIIVSRAHYQEFVQHYPVTRLSELKQILNTEYQDSNNVMHFIGPEQDQRRAVCSIVFAASVMQCFQHTCLLIPETLLLWHAARSAKSTVDTVASPRVLQVSAFVGYFLYCGDVTPVSQRINLFCKDYQSFMLNSGVPDVARCVPLADGDYAASLVQALGKAIPVLHRMTLFNRPELNITVLPLKAIALTAATVALAYMLSVTAYYQLALSSQQDKIARLGGDINQLLDIQQQLQTVSAAADTLAKLRADKHYSAHIWQLLLLLLEQDSSLALQNLATDNGRIILRGQASQATSVLTAIRGSALVKDARFDASVRRQRDKDVFVISLVLTQQQPVIAVDNAAPVQETTDAAE